MSKTKTIAYFGIGIALYVVLSMAMKIPIIGHIQTDLGYIVFSVYLALFGWQALIIGVVGCMIESLIINGWIPIGWMVGQAIIGIICGVVFQKYDKNSLKILWILISVFLGIGCCKTLIECFLYDIPVMIKFPRNIIAFIPDSIAMILGLYISDLIKDKVKT